MRLPLIGRVRHLKQLIAAERENRKDDTRRLKVAWITYFPVEWLPDLPPELQTLPKLHPASWQRVLWEEFLQEEKLDLHVVVLRNHFPTSMRFRRGNTTFHCVKTLPGARAPLLFWMDTVLVARVLKEIRPDLVHAWGTEFGAAAIAGRLGYPALVTMQGILTWYGSVFPLNSHAKLARLIEPSSLRKAHVVTCESSFGMSYLAERYPHLKLLQVEHAPDPIFSKVVRRPQLEPIRILCVGAFVSWKGVYVVMEALAGLVVGLDFELIWVGSGNVELETELRQKTGEALWERVTIKHGLKASEVAEEMSKATIFLHAALADNSPNAVKEAVVAGVPVVATNTGGIPDYVFPEQNGYLFESGNAGDCREKLKQALAHPLFSRGQVEEKALGRVRDYLSARMMAEKFRGGYATALQFDPRARKKN